MRNFDRAARMDREDEARRAGVKEGLYDEPGLADVHTAFDLMTMNEARSDSESSLLEEPINEALESYSRVRPAIRSMTQPEILQPGVFAPRYDRNKALLHALESDIVAARKQNPEAGLKTLSEIMAETKEKTKADREKAMQLYANARGMAKLGAFTGPAAALVTDPLVLGTMPLGGGAITGGSVAANAWKAFKVEALIAGASESLIQPQVFHWKKQINSPYSVGEAATNIITAMAAAGVIRATGSALVDVVQLRKAAEIKRTENTPRANQEADILEQYADDIETGGDNVPEHFDNIDQALDDLDLGQTTTAGRAEHVEEVDPRTVGVDAERFQFKAGTDTEGVSERLKGVQRWDPKLAGIAIVYEQRNGSRFIVDGHQRVSLARRMLDAGQNPDEVRLNAIVLREADGVTDADARQIAAVKNIAEGTGSAVDTAKIFRELGESGLDLMPSLPPRSALVVAGRGLAALDDEAFSMVINGVVDERYGAIVGELVTDAAEQRAIISALAQDEPANVNQARLMINDMKAAGFQRTETEDLFGGQEVAESLFKERARILDNAMKRLRQDKATFKTLQRQAGEIESAGNVLDQQANIARSTADEQTLTELSKLANTKGPISDALNRAARELKEGGNLNRATTDFLDAARRPGAVEPAAGARAGDTGSAEQEPGVKPKIEPPEDLPHSVEIVDIKGKKVAKVKIDRSQLDIDSENFGYPELPRTLDDADPLLEDTQKKYQNPKTGKYKSHRARKHNQWIKEALDAGEVAPEGTRPIAYLMGGGGASGKGSVLKILQSQGEVPSKGLVHVDPDEIKKLIPEYDKIQKAGDSRAAMVVHEESSDVSKAIIERATNERRGIVIDKVMGNERKGLEQIQDLRDKGYEVRVIGVTIEPEEALIRALERYYGSGRLPSGDALMAAHKGFNSAFPAYARVADETVLFDNTTTPAVIAEAKAGKLDVYSETLYNRVERRGNLDEQAKTIRQIQESTGGQQVQDRSGGVPEADRARPGAGDTGAPGQAARADRVREPAGDEPVLDLFGEDNRAAQSLHDARLEIERALHPDDVVPVEAGPGDLFSGKSRQTDIEDEVDRLVYERDLDIPVDIEIDADGNVVPVTRGAREVYEEIDTKAKALDDLEGCYLGKTT